MSKKSVIDYLAKPIIKVEITPRRFIEPGTEVTLNASKTLSLSSSDIFSYDWDYLDGQNYPELGFTTHGYVTFTAPNLPADKSLYFFEIDS